MSDHHCRHRESRSPTVRPGHPGTTRRHQPVEHNATSRYVRSRPGYPVTFVDGSDEMINVRSAGDGLPAFNTRFNQFAWKRAERAEASQVKSYQSSAYLR